MDHKETSMIVFRTFGENVHTYRGCWNISVDRHTHGWVTFMHDGVMNRILASSVVNIMSEKAEVNPEKSGA